MHRFTNLLPHEPCRSLIRLPIANQINECTLKWHPATLPPRLKFPLALALTHFQCGFPIWRKGQCREHIAGALSKTCVVSLDFFDGQINIKTISAPAGMAGFGVTLQITITRGHGVVRSALEYIQVPRLLGDHWDGLYG